MALLNTLLDGTSNTVILTGVALLIFAMCTFTFIGLHYNDNK